MLFEIQYAVFKHVLWPSVVALGAWAEELDYWLSANFDEEWERLGEESAEWPKSI